jgi:hypothetical protein
MGVWRTPVPARMAVIGGRRSNMGRFAYAERVSEGV